MFLLQKPKKTLNDKDLNGHMDRENSDEILLPKVLQAPEETVHI